MTHAVYAPRVAAHPTRTGKARTSPIRLLVIHTSEGNEAPTAAENLAAFISRPRVQNPDGSWNLASYHYIADNDKVIPLVPDGFMANAASGGNQQGIHICHPGRAAQSREWFDQQSQTQLEQTARWLADKSQQYNVPLDRLNHDQVRAGHAGICGHHEVSQAFKQSTHTDPGKDYPWDWVITRAAALANPEPRPDDSGWPPFDPAQGHYSLYPLAPKPHTSEGTQSDSVKYAQGVMRNEVSRFAAWFLAGGQADSGTRELYLAACRDTSAALKVDGVFGNVTRTAVEFMQLAFRHSAYDGQAWGDLPAAGVAPGQIDRETWTFIDAQSNGVWAG